MTSMTPGLDLESLISSAAGGDWGWFADVEATIAKRRAAAASSEGERKELARAFVACFDTPAGNTVLEAILGKTLRRFTFACSLGIDPQQALLYGAFREGQNALATEILRLIAEGRQEPSPQGQEL